MVHFDALIHYRRHILDSSKLKEFADDNFKFDENSSKLSKLVENTVWKGEIARYEQFLSVSHSVFKRLVSKGRQKVSLCGNGLKIYLKLSLYFYPKWYLSSILNAL